MWMRFFVVLLGFCGLMGVVEFGFWRSLFGVVCGGYKFWGVGLGFVGRVVEGSVFVGFIFYGENFLIF